MKKYLIIALCFLFFVPVFSQDDKATLDLDDEFFNDKPKAETTNKPAEVKPIATPSPSGTGNSETRPVSTPTTEPTKPSANSNTDTKPKPVVASPTTTENNPEFHFSYVSDKKFPTDIDLYGYVFVPEKIRFGAEKGEKLLSPGQVSVSILQGMIIIKGINDAGSYNILSMTTQKFGYEIELMNNKKTSLLAKAKILLDDKDQVDAITFQVKNGASYILLQAYKTDALMNKELEFFTKLKQLTLRNPQVSLNGKSVRPFFKIEQGAYGTRQSRIYMDEDYGLAFTATHVKVFKAGGDTVSYAIKKVKENHSERMNDENKKYQYQFELVDFPNKYLYLYADATNRITSYTIGNVEYFMLNEEEITEEEVRKN